MVLRWNPPQPPRKKTAVHSNTANHALIVHNGAVLRGGTVLPPRPWMESAYVDNPSGFDAVDFFCNEFRNTQNLSRSFRGTAQEADRQMRLLIRGKLWSWPRSTVRTSGETVSSPRNIVDTGELLRKQQRVRFQ